MNRKILIGVLLGGTLAAGAASAHHSFAAFDMQKSVTVNGVVKEFQWTNPHSWITVTGSDNKVYKIETSSPAQLGRRGWKKSSVKAGDKIAITIHPSKNGELGGAMVKTVINGTLVGYPNAAPE